MRRQYIVPRGLFSRERRTRFSKAVTVAAWPATAIAASATMFVLQNDSMADTQRQTLISPIVTGGTKIQYQTQDAQVRNVQQQRRAKHTYCRSRS